MGYSLGIDFGTSATKVAIRTDGDRPVHVPISKSGDGVAMPSVVSYRRTSGSTAMLYAIGEDADDSTPDSEDFIIVRDIKRFLEMTDTRPGAFPYHQYPWWDSEARCVRLWQTSLTVEDVVRAIMEEALKRAVRRARDLALLPPRRTSRRQRVLEFLKRIIGRPIGTTEVLAVRGWPVSFGCSAVAGLESRRVLRDVAHNLGFDGFRFEHIREEPVLASLPYLREEMHPGETALVCDFGGGTFDSAVIRVDPESSSAFPRVTVLSTEGIAFCGGVDIDRYFAKHLAERMAQQVFGSDCGNRSQEILEQRYHQLVYIARETKELLSDRTQHTVSMLLGSPDGAVIEMDVTRQELEHAITESEVLERIERCILSAWRKARVVWRQDHEVCHDIHVEVDANTGRVYRTLFDLDFEDMSHLVDRVLLIGGTTKIPIVRECLRSHLPNVQFIADRAPHDPIVACALGAASQTEHVNSVVDRLPFSIVVKKPGEEILMYPAYAPTVFYDVQSTHPRIRGYFSANVCSIGDRHDCVAVECISPDGEVISRATELAVVPGRHVLSIDQYGRVLFGGLPVPNPWQHELQRKMVSRIQEEELRLEEEGRKRMKKFIYRKPGEERDVG